MKKRILFIVTAMLLVMHSFTAIIGEPGGLGYQLVIKPYPSLLKSIPGREEGAWNRAVASGEIPEWVASHRYVVIGSGDPELHSQHWEPLYLLSFPLTACCTLVSLTFILRSSIAAVRRRSSS